MIDHRELIQLLVAYTLTGALIFTVIATCLSLVGWVKFVDAKQQNKLFYVLIVELVTVAVGFYSQTLLFDPAKVGKVIAVRGQDQVLNALLDDNQRNTALIHLYWKPNGKDVNLNHEAILKQWLQQHELDNSPGSLTMFIRAREFEPLRKLMVHDLSLDRRATRIMTDVPEAALDETRKNFEALGFKVSAERQPDGKWTVTATQADAGG